MLRLRFGSGVILGLVLGIPAGAVVTFLLAPAPSIDPGATTLQVQELTRKLEAAKDDRQRVDQQLEQFQKLAEQMTASFNNLDQRFRALQEEQRLQELAVKPAAVTPVPQPPAAAAPAPQPQPPQVPPAAAPGEGAAPAGADNAAPLGDEQ